VDALLPRRLEELQPVAEWVVRVHAPETGELSVPVHVLAGFAQSVNHVIKIGDHNARVPLAGWSEIVLDPEVQFDVACSEPRATTCRENGRLVDLGHAQDADEEVASDNVGELSRRHRIFAIDILGDAGRSVAPRTPRSAAVMTSSPGSVGSSTTSRWTHLRWWRTPTVR